MSVLSDKTIKDLVKKGELLIEPYEEKNVKSVSVDLRLGEGFLVPDYHNTKSIRLGEKPKYREVEGKEIVIHSHHFILATTLENICLPNNIFGSVEGRSSVGRQGLFVQNASVVAPGFKGNITLELYNANEYPLVLTEGDGICQILFYFTDQPVEHPYRGRYHGQKGTTGTRP